MPQITRSARADYDTTNAIRTPTLAGLQASVAIPGAGVPCTIDANGKAKPAASGDVLCGYSSRDALVGEDVTLFVSGRFHYADSGLTPGAAIYRDATTAGELTTTAAGTAIGYAVSTTDVMLGGVL